MSTKKIAPTLADQIIHEYGRSTYRHGYDVHGWVPRNIAAARKFVLDEKMSAFMSDLAYSMYPKSKQRNNATPGNIKRAVGMIESMRQMARLPHKNTWIEFDMMARIARARDIYDVDLRPEAGPAQGGWLLQQHPQLDTAFMAIEAVSHSITDRRGDDGVSPLPHMPNISPVAYVWTVDDAVPPWKLFGQAEGTHHLASPMLTGIGAYKATQVGWTLSPWVTTEYAKSMIDRQFFTHMQQQLASDLRYLWALLSAINDTPVSYRAVTPTKGHMVGRDYKRFSAHTVVTLQVPHKMDLKRLAKKVAVAARRRAHQVRGHFRKDWRHPGEKIWIAEHQRGDASLGFVLHDYKVEHPA